MILNTGSEHTFRHILLEMWNASNTTVFETPKKGAEVRTDERYETLRTWPAAPHFAGYRVGAGASEATIMERVPRSVLSDLAEAGILPTTGVRRPSLRLDFRQGLESDMGSRAHA